MSFPTHFLSPSTFFRCEAINKANEANPAVTQMSYRVFFPPKSLRIVVDRADKEIGYDRTIDFESSASNTRNREDLRIVVEGELVRIRCQAGNTICRHPQEFSALFCNNTNMGDPLLQNRYFFPLTAGRWKFLRARPLYDFPKYTDNPRPFHLENRWHFWIMQTSAVVSALF